MGNTSSQPEPFPEIPENFGDIIPETPNSSMVDGTKKKGKKRLSSASKALSPATAEANGATRSPEIDSNMSNPSKRKRESEPEQSEPVRKQNPKKNRKSENIIAESASPENNSPPSAIAVQIPPTPSQSTPSKPKPKSSAKKSRKQNGEELESPALSIPQPTPDLPATEEPPAVNQLAATKQAPAPDSPNPEGSTTPGGRAKGVRGSRTREKDNLKIGFYTPEEVQKIEAYKLNFCTVHGIASAKFDEMVQHSERGANGEFPVSSDVISKSDFWDEIYALVPDRDRRSVYRFMRRHFQASAQKAHDWSKEQEDELIALHAKHGPKWTYIGKLIGRSDDDVTQRWKNKLEHQGTMNQGAWSEEETRIFLAAVESTWNTMKPMLAGKSTKDMYELDERLIVWGNISKEMGHMRSRQQCADKWRKIVKQVMTMRANGHPGAVFDPKLAAKKSAHWNLRLEAQRKSSQFVNEDSDNDEATKTTKQTLEPNGEVAPSPIANANIESAHDVQSEEGEPDLPEPPKKAKKSKSKRKHNEDPASGPVKESPSSPATPKKSKEERKREKKERREKEKQEQIEQEAQEDKAARKERKRKRKEEKKKRKRLEEEEANKPSSSGAEAPEPPKKKKKSKKQKQASSDSPAPLAEPSRPVIEETPPPAPPASHGSATEHDAIIDESDSDGGDGDSSEVNVKYETDSDEL
ncbi:hypothetical protein PENSOL_c001G05125 [Penicillium solitum]|uniref:Myb-like domain-containing protein n=1 Tax=Penicillium solitum TaxID=60172 RepID=A0A1V6RNA5_9EURO|nr:uncharacterized protein PENSOL_c001G05125 [Penicillium solitum]OQE03272.1 hypothetical protein PENSOL_c001G05125 [Penicillium solitum]